MTTTTHTHAWLSVRIPTRRQTGQQNEGRGGTRGRIACMSIVDVGGARAGGDSDTTQLWLVELVVGSGCEADARRGVPTPARADSGTSQLTLVYSWDEDCLLPASTRLAYCSVGRRPVHARIGRTRASSCDRARAGIHAGQRISRKSYWPPPWRQPAGLRAQFLHTPNTSVRFAPLCA